MPTATNRAGTNGQTTVVGDLAQLPARRPAARHRRGHDDLRRLEPGPPPPRRASSIRWPGRRRPRSRPRRPAAPAPRREDLRPPPSSTSSRPGRRERRFADRQAVHDRPRCETAKTRPDQGECAHGQLRSTRRTDLAHHDQPQRSRQPRGDLGRHRHPAAGQGQHHRPSERAEAGPDHRRAPARRRPGRRTGWSTHLARAAEPALSGRGPRSPGGRRRRSPRRSWPS